jgi:hypothetical protein
MFEESLRCTTLRISGVKAGVKSGFKVKRQTSLLLFSQSSWFNNRPRTRSKPVSKAQFPVLTSS